MRAAAGTRRRGALLNSIGICTIATLIAMTRAGIALLWTPAERPPVPIRVVEALPIATLLALCLALVIQAGPALRYAQATAAALGTPARYVAAVLGTPQ